jgi:hypothetical protein
MSTGESPAPVVAISETGRVILVSDLREMYHWRDALVKLVGVQVSRARRGDIHWPGLAVYSSIFQQPKFPQLLFTVFHALKRRWLTVTEGNSFDADENIHVPPSGHRAVNSLSFSS